MWGRVISDHKNGFLICSRQTGSDVAHTGWVQGCEAVWQAPVLLTSGRNNTSRRFSATSDSGDTGIGTSSSDSIEEHSSGISSFKPIRSHVAIPTAHVMPSTSNPSLSRLGEKDDGAPCTKVNLSKMLPSKSQNVFTRNPSLDMKDPRPIRKWSSLTKLNGTGTESPDCEFAGNGNSANCMATVTNFNVKPSTYGETELDNFTYRNRECSKTQETKRWDTSTKEFCQSQCPISDGQYKFESFYNAAGDSSLSSSSPSKKRSDLALSALTATKAIPDDLETYRPRRGFTSWEHKPACGATTPSSLRTQRWLSDQMQATALGLGPTEDSCAFTGWQQKQPQEQLRQEADQKQMHTKSPLQVSMVYPTQLDHDPCQKDAQLKIKEGLLRKKDMIIERQEQQIFQLQRKIQENELQVQKAFLEHVDPVLLLKTQQLHPPCENVRHSQLTEMSKVVDCGKKDLQQRLSAAELEIARLKENLKKNAQKYMEDTKRIEEKMKAREKYISSLKKKMQKESEQSHERQQRIETLEKYLADLPTLDDFQSQSQQLTILEEKNEQFQSAFKDFERKLGENRVLCREKEVLLENLKKREKELVTTVQSLQQKVEKCLEDGVRLPMLDMKQLQNENDYLRKRCEHASKVIDNQEQQIEKSNLEKKALEERLAQEKFASQMFRKELGETQRNLQLLKDLMEDNSSKNQRTAEENSNLEERSQETEKHKHSSAEERRDIQMVLKEMSNCLRDLQALCNILTQRAQGKEPNLSLLLGIQCKYSLNILLIFYSLVDN
ncbi:centrosomal protein of 85 kDa-like isoform X1 [Hemitrygon akajei]|uniref:centrosomal protein of 85 kDa-like isoform X1 n=1 Tax=Hemitrygon akajei TaxID=2704970 RepID=UPI003BFA04C4